MAGHVKRQSTRRDEKTRATRRRILDAALQLFVADGYALTTINAIATTADVAVQTVYAVFGNKRSILDELLARAVVGDDEQRPLREREEWKAMEQERDPRQQLAQLAVIATRIGERMAPLYEVMSAAAGSDPEIADRFRRQQEARYDDEKRVARALSRRKALRKGMTSRDASDILWTIASPKTHHSLVTERGWPTERYQRWLTDVLIASLLS